VSIDFTYSATSHAHATKNTVHALREDIQLTPEDFTLTADIVKALTETMVPQSWLFTSTMQLDTAYRTNSAGSQSSLYSELAPCEIMNCLMVLDHIGFGLHSIDVIKTAIQNRISFMTVP